jgi:chaperonin GroES
VSTTAHKTNGLNITAATLRPLADRVVAKAVAREEMTKSGILLPDTSKDKPMRATVVAVGEGRRAEDGRGLRSRYRPGDQVLFTKYGGTEFTLDEEELLILSEKDILAVVRPKPSRSQVTVNHHRKEFVCPRFWSSTPRRVSP